LSVRLGGSITDGERGGAGGIPNTFKGPLQRQVGFSEEGMIIRVGTLSHVRLGKGKRYWEELQMFFASGGRDVERRQDQRTEKFKKKAPRRMFAGKRRRLKGARVGEIGGFGSGLGIIAKINRGDVREAARGTTNQFQEERSKKLSGEAVKRREEKKKG